MKRSFFPTTELNLFSFPVLGQSAANTRRRGITDLKDSTAAQMLSATGVTPHSTLLCGRLNKTFPILRQLLRMSERPFLLIGTEHDLEEDSCLKSLPVQWESNRIEKCLPPENGLLTVDAGAGTLLSLCDSLPTWGSHLLVLCLGRGIQVDPPLLNRLNAHGQFILLSESLSRSVKCAENSSFSVETLLLSLDHLLISAIGSSAKALMAVLPTYDCEKLSNALDWSSHQDAPSPFRSDHHHRNGSGWRISQSRTMETRGILTHSELLHLQNNGSLFIYNAKTAHAWVTQIVR